MKRLIFGSWLYRATRASWLAIRIWRGPFRHPDPNAADYDPDDDISFGIAWELSRGIWLDQ